MAEIQITVNNKAALAKLKRLKRLMTPERTMPIIAREIMFTKRRVVAKTPKRWTGQTRRSWQTVSIPNGLALTNISKVMIFLEKGTRAHGPVRAKRLYIPLKRKAAIGGWRPSLVYGSDYVLAKRVKGIRAMRIVANERPKMRERIMASMVRYISSSGLIT